MEATLKYLILFIVLSTAHFIQANELKETHVNVVFTAEMPEIHANNKRYAKLSTFLKQTRAANENTFFFFGGGSLGPSILSAFDQGSHIIDLLNSIEPDAMGVSKREFSFYAQNLSLRSYDATFPIVATNIIDESTGKELDGLVRGTIALQNNISIGFLSIIDDSVIEDYTFRQISLIDPKTAIKRGAEKLRREGADIVLLHYTGYYPVITQLLDEGVIDFSVHKDDIFDESMYVNRTYHQRDVFVKKEHGVALIKLGLSKDNPSNIISFQVKVEDIDTFDDDKVIARQLSGYINRLQAILSVEIGQLGVDLSTQRFDLRTKENAFGNYIADSIKVFANAQLAIINSGSIRGNKSYKAGEKLTRGTIVNELPFRGKVVLIKLTGSQIFKAFENGFGSYRDNKGRFPQISGVRVEFDSSKPSGQRVKSIKLNGKDLVLTESYRVATTDYLASGGDGYYVFKEAPHIADKQLKIRLVSDIVMDSILEDKKIQASVEGRLINVKSIDK